MLSTGPASGDDRRLGPGRVAYYAARYIAALGGVDELIFSDAQPARAMAMAETLNQLFHGRPRCEALANGHLPETDVLMFATTSTRPVSKAGDVRTKLIVSVGADTEEQHELAESWVTAGDLYVDCLDSARVGDVRAWVAAGLVQETQLTDLLGLLRRGAKPTNGHPVIFISTGSALFDNLTLAYLLDHLGR